jgi:hypothetical protein
VVRQPPAGSAQDPRQLVAEGHVDEHHMIG